MCWYHFLFTIYGTINATVSSSLFIADADTFRLRQHLENCRCEISVDLVLRHNHAKRQVERQAACQAARSHWNTLWRSKMGPRSIPKRHGKRQNFKAATRCGYSFTRHPS